MDSNRDKFRNIEAEMSVLGACFFDPNEALLKVGYLRSDDFLDPRHCKIWESIMALHQKSEPLDVVAVTSELRQKNQFETVGKGSYLNFLLEFVPTAANSSYYAHLVRECSRRRKLAEKGHQIISFAQEAETADEALDQAESSLTCLHTVDSNITKPDEVANLMSPALDRLEKLKHEKEPIIGIPTGFPDLDRLTCGLQRGELIIVAGRPSMGKTALALNIYSYAARNEYRSLFFSLEMSKEQLVHRLLSSTANIDANLFRNGRIDDANQRKLEEASATLQRLPMLIDDRANITIHNIRTASRKAQRDGGLDLVIIDYLQLIRPVRLHQVREREVAEISRSLKALAKELSIPVVVLAQLNRGVETGGTQRRPIPSDLRESGSLEQDADLILFPWREAAYCEKCKARQGDCGKGHYRTAEIIIGKQRNGPTGIVRAAWLGEFTRFESL